MTFADNVYMVMKKKKMQQSAVARAASMNVNEKVSHALMKF